jgi:hypothetical protein
MFNRYSILAALALITTLAAPANSQAPGAIPCAPR